MTSTARTRAVLSLAWLRTDEFRALITRFGSAETALAQSAADLGAAGLTADKAERLAAPDEEAVRNVLQWLEPDDQALLLVSDDTYPPLLADTRDPPLCLYVKGSVDSLSLPALAIVGSRNPTRGGARNARDFARHLAEIGFTVVSGLAEGIDASAHAGALDVGGLTVGVMGTGIDRIYPSRHRDLAHRIAGSGALITEYPPGTPPRRQNFPERNRLITGLCLGTLVVEAAIRSGSLISARLAAEQGREVFAIPGSIHNPLSKGCHRLIREGAKLVEASDDILAELRPLIAGYREEAPETSALRQEPDNESSEHDSLLEALGHDPVGIDELLEVSGLTIAELSSMLLILELEGKVEKLAGGQYARLEDA